MTSSFTRTCAFAAALALAVAALSGPVSAQPGYDADQRIMTYDLDTLSAILVHFNGTVERRAVNGRNDRLVWSLYDGPQAVTILNACDSNGANCRGAYSFVDFRPPAEASVAEIDAFIAETERRIYSLGIVRLADRRIRVNYYSIADHGVTMGNLSTDLSVLATNAGKVAEAVEKRWPSGR